MPYVIYDPETSLCPSRKGREQWRPLESAALFDSVKTARAALRTQQTKWNRYVISWVGHPNHAHAVAHRLIWDRSVVKEVAVSLVKET